MQDGLILRAPRLEDERAFRRAHAATSPAYPSFAHFYEDGMPFDRYLAVLDDASGGRLSGTPDVVPETFLFAFVGVEIVGRAAIRHRLTTELARTGGHIGYVVVPEHRRRGYATAILRLSLEVARDAIGLGRVLVTCDDTNIGSIRTIEKNGGVLENVVRVTDEAVAKRRYWIDLPRP